MTSLRDLLDDPQFQAVAREVEAEARKLGFRPVNAYLANPPLRHHKLKRNRIQSRAARRRGKVTIKLVPGRGPHKYRLKLVQADVMPLISRLQRLTWDNTKQPSINGMCQCKWSEPKPCKRCPSK